MNPLDPKPEPVPPPPPQAASNNKLSGEKISFVEGVVLLLFDNMGKFILLMQLYKSQSKTTLLKRDNPDHYYESETRMEAIELN